MSWVLEIEKYLQVEVYLSFALLDGSPKIKLFKEHFGDEFNIKIVELKELLGGLTR
jgi:hypothetical protein